MGLAFGGGDGGADASVAAGDERRLADDIEVPACALPGLGGSWRGVGWRANWGGVAVRGLGW